ncbi:hypothetical protein SAMN05428985_101496 [Nocardioides sp. YR527]|uniref:hypothetical protein n=1 Tax=Nocardioides sp. YR527 TaxID=1881028 RepID=UPI0008889F63|nr:hypothetical protein [Nocardioides sp. YR527]SDJ79526.1 hypothetical protein SAMN05428985_101496 [Nocardioides sp. YR527]
MHADPHQSAGDRTTLLTTLGELDVTGPMEPVLGGLPGSLTAQATLWLSTRLAAAVRSYVDGLADLGAPVQQESEIGPRPTENDYLPPTGPPGLAEVGGWSTKALTEAARRVRDAADAVESHLHEVPGLLTAATPEERDAEVRSGELLLKALRHARWAMHDGAANLDAALAELTEATAVAVAAGHPLLDDPQTHPVSITAALARVARADAATAAALHDIEFPESLTSRIAAYLARVMATRQVVASLGEEGEGALAVGKVAKSAGGVVGKGSAYVRFLRTTLLGLTRSRSLGALRQFARGSTNGGFLRFLIGARLARGVGWIFLPLTFLTGAIDAVTGGGESGVRGWTNRLVGLAGATGAAVLLVTQLRWTAAGPAALSLAGAAVLGFSLWSLGTMVWDHRARIGTFLGAVGSRLRTARGPSRSAGRARRGRP